MNDSNIAIHIQNSSPSYLSVALMWHTDREQCSYKPLVWHPAQCQHLHCVPVANQCTCISVLNGLVLGHWKWVSVKWIFLIENRDHYNLSIGLISTTISTVITFIKLNVTVSMSDIVRQSLLWLMNKSPGFICDIILTHTYVTWYILSISHIHVVSLFYLSKSQTAKQTNMERIIPISAIQQTEPDTFTYSNCSWPLAPHLRW